MGREVFSWGELGGGDPAVACVSWDHGEISRYPIVPPQVGTSFVQGKNRVHSGEERYIVSIFVIWGDEMGRIAPVRYGVISIASLELSRGGGRRGGREEEDGGGGFFCCGRGEYVWGGVLGGGGGGREEDLAAGARRGRAEVGRWGEGGEEEGGRSGTVSGGESEVRICLRSSSARSSFPRGVPDGWTAPRRGTTEGNHSSGPRRSNRRANRP